MEGGGNMNKEEIALKLTLVAMERFDYKVSEYAGNTIQEHASYISEISYKIYNDIYNNLTVKE